MDMSTVRKNLDKGRYKYFEELFADILLIWNNCKTYNVSGSEIYKFAETMERRSKKLIRDLKVSLKLEQSASVNASAGSKDENLKQEVEPQHDGTGDEIK